MKQYLFLLIFSLVSVTPSSTNLSLNSSYLYDFLPTQIMIHDVSMRQGIRPQTDLTLNAHYLYYAQPEHKGVKELDAGFLSIQAGVSNSFEGVIRSVDLAAGIDLVPGVSTIPSGSLETRIAIPPFTGLSLTTGTWYTGRIVKAAALLNSIASAGFSGEINTPLGNGGEISLSYQHAYFIPSDSLLDTTLFQSRDNGIFNQYDSMLTIETNLVQTISVYLYSLIVNPLYLGYSFEWKNSRDNRYMLTGEEVIYSQGGPGQRPTIIRHQSYSDFPFSGTDFPLNRFTHQLIASVPVMFRNLKTTASLSFPFYSSERKISYPEYIDGTDPSDNYLKYRTEYTQKFTSPMTAELLLEYALNQRCTVSLRYGYFTFPYESWGYFTSSRYYLNSFNIKIDYGF